VSKKNRLRHCPAAGRAIETVECAEGRHMTYACPESCPFNVFASASYPKFLEIERSADEKFMRWVERHATDPRQFEADMRRLLAEEDPSPAFFHRLAWHGSYRTGPDGNTCLGKWAKAGFPGLGADERVIMRARMRMSPAIFEVHRILDLQRVEVVDLLAPERAAFVIMDSGFGHRASRFEVYSGHIIPLPHYTRPLGTCLLIPNFHPLAAEEVIQEIIGHLGGPGDNPGRRAWLAEHFEEFDRALEAVALARRRAMFDALDGQFGKAAYTLARPLAECLDQLKTVREIADDPLSETEKQEGFTGARVWFAGPGDPEKQQIGEGAVMGRMLVGPTHWRLEAIGADRLARLRERFEQLLGPRVAFKVERRDDLAAQVRMNEPEYDPTLVPPALLRETTKLVVASSRVQARPGAVPGKDSAAAVSYEREQGILDEPIPALNNQTPRAAASDPALRPQLLRWMKFWVSQTDRRNLETGRNDDTRWMVRELGLTEILFEPPPPRPRPAGADEDELPLYLSLPDPPPLADRPWTKEEAAELIRRALRPFTGKSHPADYFTDLEYPLFPDLNELVGKEMQETEIPWLFQAAAWVVLCYAPRGTRPPDYAPEDLKERLDHHLTELARWGDSGFELAFSAWLHRSRQPELLALILAMILSLMEKAPPKLRGGDWAKALLITVLGAVVDTLDEAARAR
jgi:hypothetical protein